MIKVGKHPAKLLLGVFMLAGMLNLTSCTEVDKTLGVDFIPDDKLRSIVLDTLYPNAFTVSTDSMRTNLSATYVVGSTHSPLFGTSHFSALTQLVPYFDTVRFGEAPQCDSVILKMILSSNSGNSKAVQTLKIYELQGNIYSDSVYYACTPVDGLVNFSSLLGEVLYNGEDTLKIRLPKDYGERLLSVPQDGMIKNIDSISTSIFSKMFPGIFITSESAKGSERVNYFSTSTFLELYYNNAEKRDTTLKCVYSSKGKQIIKDGYRKNIYSPNFNVVKQDYSQADPSLKVAHLNDTNPTTGIDTVVYLQGLYGAAPYISIPYEQLAAWLSDNKIAQSEAAIIRAELILEMQSYSEFDIKNYPAELGAFVKQNDATAYNDACLPSFRTYKNSKIFDGVINPTLRKYSMNITSDIIKAVQNKKNVEFYITPYDPVQDATSGSVYYYIKQNVPYSAVFKGSGSSTPIKLVLSYTKPR